MAILDIQLFFPIQILQMFDFKILNNVTMFRQEPVLPFVQISIFLCSGVW